MPSTTSNVAVSNSSKDGRRWRRPFALVSAFAASMLGLGVLGQVMAPRAEAYVPPTWAATGAGGTAWKSDAPGVDRAGAGYATNASTLGTVYQSSQNLVASTVPKINTNLLYGTDGYPNANIAAISTTDALRTQQFAAHSNVGQDDNSTNAIDAGAVTGNVGYYTWYWGPGTGGGAPAQRQPIYFWEQGASTATAVYYVPLPTYFGHTAGDAYYSGGVINQKTGMLYLGQGECDGIGSAGTARFAIFDPATGTTYFSGQLKPQTAGDNLWTTSGNSCGGIGYIASGAAMTASGQFVMVVNGTNVAIPASDPRNPTGQDIPAGTDVSWLVSLHPSMNDQPWTYSVMRMIWNGGTGTNATGNRGGITSFYGVHHYGTAFVGGYLYVASDFQIHRVNPLTGVLTTVGPTNQAVTDITNPAAAAHDGRFYDLASTQTAASIIGTVYQDPTGAGVFSTSNTPVAGQTVGIYEKGGINGYTTPTLIGTAVTDSSGQYTLMVPDYNGDGSVQYYVRLVQPTLNLDGGTTNPVNAVVTSGAVRSDTFMGAADQAVLTCTDGNTITGDSAGTQISGACRGVSSNFTSDSQPLGQVGVATFNPATTKSPYATITMKNSWTDPEVDFSIAATNLSFGDSPSGPATTTDGAPVHNNTYGVPVQLGATAPSAGAQTAPATNDSHTTDDGVTLTSGAGAMTTQIPLTGTILSAQKAYHTLSANVVANNGYPCSAATLACYLAAWTTGPGNNTWATTPVWPTAGSPQVVPAGMYSHDFQYNQSGAPSIGATPQAVSLRVSVSTVPQTRADNSAGEYQGTATVSPAWTTPGEIEDYTFKVADAVWRPAAITTGGSGDGFVVGPTPASTLNGVNSSTVTFAKPPVGAVASTPQTVYVAPPNPHFTVVSVQIEDTQTGAIISTPTVPATGGSFTYTPTAASDVTILATFSEGPSQKESTLAVDKTTSVVTHPVTATVTVKDAGKNPLAGITATVNVPTTTAATATGDSGVAGKSATCVTGADGTCKVTINDANPEAVAVSAFIPIDGVSTQVTNSPTTVTFTYGTISTDKSYFSCSPDTRTDTTGATWPVANGTASYTCTFYALNDDGNPVPNVDPATLPFTASSGVTVSATTAGATAGTYQATFKSTVASPSYVAGISYDGTPIKVQNGTATSWAIPFKPGNPTSTNSTLAVSTNETKIGTPVTATATLLDANNNPVPNVPVKFTITGAATMKDAAGANQTSPYTATTNSQGVATMTLTDDTAEAVTVGATINYDANGNPTVTDTNIKNSPQTVTFTSGPPSSQTSWLTVTPTTTQVKNYVTATATIVDAKNNPVAGVPVTFTVNNSATVTDANKTTTTAKTYTVNTNSTGVATAMVTDATAEDVSVAATILYDATGNTTTTPQNIKNSPTTVTFQTGDFCFEPDTSSFTVSPVADPANTAMTNWQPADGTSYYTGTLTAMDCSHNLLKNLPLTNIAFTANSGDVLGTQSVTNNNDGTYTVHLTSLKASSTYTAAVAYQGTQVDTDRPIPFKAGTPDPNLSTLTTDKTTQTVTQPIVATATVVDANNNAIAGAQVTFTVDGSATMKDSDSVSKTSPYVATTNSQGVATVTVTDTKAEPVNIGATVSVNGTATNIKYSPAKVTFTAGAVDPARSYITVDPSNQTAGSNVVVSVALRDAYDNPISGLQSSQIVMSGTDAATPSALPALVFSKFTPSANGIYTYETTSQLMGTFNLSATVTANGATAVLIDHGQPPASTRPVQVTFKAGDVCTSGCTPVDGVSYTNIKMTTNDQLANGQAPDVATGYAYDAFGNPVQGATFAVTDQTTGSNGAGMSQVGKLTPGTQTSGPTDATGKTTLSWTTTVYGTYTAGVKVSSAGVHDLTVVPPNSNLDQIRFTPGNADASKSKLEITPAAAQVVGSAFNAKVTILDSSGNPLSGVSVAFATVPTTTTLSDTSCQTKSDGTCSINVSSTVAGTYQVHATLSGAELGGTNDSTKASPQPVTFYAGPADATHTTVSVAPPSVDADGTTPEVITVTAKDRYDNPVATTVTVTPPSAVTIATPSAQTNPATGVATFNATSSTVGTFNVPVSVTTPTGSITPTTSPAILNFGSKGELPPVLTVTPTQSQTVGSTFAVTATVRDQLGHGLPDKTITFNLPADLTTAAGATTATCTTQASGSCTPVDLKSTKVGSYQVTATSTGGTSNVVVLDFTVGPISATQSTVRVTTDHMNYNGQAQDIATVTAMDQYGNAIQGATVTSAKVTPSDDLTIVTPISPTQVDGTTTIAYTSTTQGAKRANVTVTDPAGNTIAPNGSPITLNFDNANGDPAHSSFSITPAGPLVVGTSSSAQYTLNAVVHDVNDAPAAGVVVTFSVDQPGTSWGSGATNSATCTTGADGTCTVPAKITSTKSGTFNFQAQMPVNTSTAYFGTTTARVWRPGPVDASHSSVVVRDDNVMANGVAQDVAIVTAGDVYGNPVNGATVASTTTDTGLTIVSGIKQTGSDTQLQPGQTAVYYTSTVAGAHIAHVTITSPETGSTPLEPTGTAMTPPGGASPITLNFTAGAPDPDKSSVTFDTTTPKAGSPATATVTVMDANSNRLSNVTATVSVPATGNSANVGSTGTAKTATCVTGTNGTCTVAVNDAKAEAVDVTTTVPINNAATPITGSPTTVTFQPTNPIPGNSTLTVDKTSLVVDQTATATATLVDGGNNATPNIPVTFTVDGSAVIKDAAGTEHGQSYTVNTGDDGKAVVSVTDSIAEPVHVAATVLFDANGKPTTTPTNIKNSPTTVTFTHDVPDGKTSTFTVSPVANTADSKTWVTADGTAYYTGTLVAKDRNGNIITDLDTSKIVFQPSSTNVSASAPTLDPVAKAYTTHFTSTVADPSYTATAAIDGTLVGPTPSTPTVANIPFTTGGPCGQTTTFTVSPVAVASDPTTWVVANGTSVYTGTLTLKDCKANLIKDEPISAITFTVNSTNPDAPGSGVHQSTVVNNNDGTYTVTFSTTKADPSYTVFATASGVIAGSTPSNQAGTVAPIPFYHGTVCTSPVTSTFAVTPVADPTDTTNKTNWVLNDGQSAYTGVVTLRDCNNNLVSDEPLANVSLTPASSDPLAPASGVTVHALTNTGNGTYTATITSTTASAGYTVQAGYKTTWIGTPKPIPFKSTGVSAANSSFVVSPVVDPTDTTAKDWVVADGQAYYTGTLTVRDAQNSVIVDQDLSTISFVVPAAVSQTAVTNNHDGTYTVRFTSIVASPGYTASAKVAGQTAGSSPQKPAGDVRPIPFFHDDPVPGDCDPAAPACTNMTVNPTTATTDGGVITATVTVTDYHGNLVPNEPVTFSVNGGAALKDFTSGADVTGKTYTVSTNATGVAKVNVTDTTVEPVVIQGKIMYGANGAAKAPTDVHGSPATVTFEHGTVDKGNSTWVVAPVADPTDLTNRVNWVKADGTAHYTGTLTLHDKGDNPVPDVPVSQIAVAASSGDVTVSAVTNAGNGLYTVTFTSTKWSAGYKASAAWNQQPIGTDLPIPFTAGNPDPTGSCTNLFIDPTAVMVAGTSTATATIMDVNCNPTPNVAVTFTVDGAAVIKDSTGASHGQSFTVNTSQAGAASIVVTDLTAQLVNVHATILYSATGPSTTPVDIKDSPGTVDFYPSAPTITAPQANATLVTTKPVASGTGTTPGNTIKVMDGTSLYCTAIVQPDGKWSCDAATRTALTPGPHTLKATETDAAGQTSPASSPVSVTVSTTPPTIDKPTAGDTLVTTKPDLSGTAPVGTTVTVMDKNNQPVPGCTDVPVTSTGTWTCTPTTALPAGANSLTPVVKDTDGGTNPGTAVPVSVDTTVPAITTPKPGETIVDTTPTLTGTGPKGGTVTVEDASGNPVPGCENVKADATTGAWSCTVSTPLTEGQTATLKPVASDSTDATNPGTPITVTPDTTPPAITNPHNGDTVVDSTPTLTGTAPKGTTVAVQDADGKPVPGCEKVTANTSTGAWTCTVSTPLPDGQAATLKPVASDSTGATNPGTPINVTPNTTKPTIDNPKSGTTVVDPKPPISGTAPDGTKVTLVDKSGNPVAGCTDLTVTNGAYNCTPTTPLPQGANTLTPKVTDPANNTNTGTPVPVTINSTKPTIDNPKAGTSVVTDKPPISGTAPDGSKVTVLDQNGTPVPGCADLTVTNGKYNCVPSSPLPQGSTTLKPQVTDPSGNKLTGDPVQVTVNTSKPTIDTPKDGSSVVSNTPSIGGHAAPGSTVDVKDGNGNTVCTTTAKADGTYTCTPTKPLPEGPTTLKPHVTDPSGNQLDGAPITVHVDTSKPIVNPTNGSKVTGKAAPGTTITVADSNGNPIAGCATVAVDGNGDWSCTPTAKPAPGSTLNIFATDAQGNKSPTTTVTVSKLGIDVQPKSLTVGNMQTVTGINFNPGETVTLTLESTPINMGQATVDANGQVRFSYAVPTALNAGQHAAILTGSQSGQVSDTFQVIALVQTGGSVAPGFPVAPIAAGGIAIVAGLWLAVARKRRDEKSSVELIG